MGGRGSHRVSVLRLILLTRVAASTPPLRQKYQRRFVVVFFLKSLHGWSPARSQMFSLTSSLACVERRTPGTPLCTGVAQVVAPCDMVRMGNVQSPHSR